MKYKGFYDDTYKHIGFIGEDDDRTPSDNFVEFSEEEMMEIFNQTNGMFIYDKDTPEDLTKIKAYEPEVIISEDMQKMIDEGKKAHQELLVEKLKTQGLIQENENLKSIIWELIPGINLTGGEIMLIEMIANQIIFGLKTFKDVPQPLKAKVKEQLELMGCGWLAE